MAEAFSLLLTGPPRAPLVTLLLFLLNPATTIDISFSLSSKKKGKWHQIQRILAFRIHSSDCPARAFTSAAQNFDGKIQLAMKERPTSCHFVASVTFESIFEKNTEVLDSKLTSLFANMTFCDLLFDSLLEFRS